MNNNIVPFSLGYEALRLLGKGMYSTVWAAMSELIANGIDAGAKNVIVYFDTREKLNTIIEIFDDGSGMTLDQITNNYVSIGKNKREGVVCNNKIMGRKGVGKLAALYLSDNYSFITKTNEGEDIWTFKADPNLHKEPSLMKVYKKDFNMKPYLENSNTGTILRLEKVNMKNLSEAALDGLSLSMSNYFLNGNLDNVNIKFLVKSTNNEKLFDKEVLMNKQIAFSNMIAIYKTDDQNIEKGKFKCPLMHTDIFTEKHIDMETEQIILDSKGTYTNNSSIGEGESIPYKLSGWIGIHYTIKQNEAQQNDKNFIKNQYYNPNQLRLYIRNKLAVANFISYLKNTQQGINYIEGEISFDLLDDDSMEDITTSNRQDLDEHDDRVVLLVEEVKKIVSALINKRKKLTDKVNAENNKRLNIIKNNAKNSATETFKDDMAALGFDEQVADKITSSFSNKMKQDIGNNLEIKEFYKVFLSHSRLDRRFSDFIFFLLKEKGVVDEEIFYTTYVAQPGKNLREDIRNNIAKDNVMLVFLDTVNFNKSQFCMFEGGAFWATRSVEACRHIHMSPRWIPKYIESELYNTLISNCEIIEDDIGVLSEKKYRELIIVFNGLIDHLNKSSLRIENKIKKFESYNAPTPRELDENNENVLDYMDDSFVKCWKYYVVEGNIGDGNVSKKETLEDYICKYNKSVEGLG